MKKNRTLKVAAILLVLTLITSCFVGGTFAKYITTNTASDQARVAHWGFDQGTATAMANLFNTDADTGILSGEQDGYTLIAPGSSGSQTFSFVNADAATNPEVAYKVTFAVTGTPATLSTELEDALVFSLKLVDGEGDDIDGSVQNNLTWPQLQAELKKLSGADTGVKEYAPNADLPDALKNGNQIVVGWTWAWSTEDAANTRDNTLGNEIIAQLETLALSITVTVEQLDVYPTP